MQYQKVIALLAAAGVMSTTAFGFAAPMQPSLSAEETEETAIPVPGTSLDSGEDASEFEKLETETPEIPEKSNDTIENESVESGTEESQLTEASGELSEESLKESSEEEIQLAEEEAISTVRVGDYDISDSIGIYDKFDYSDPQYITDELLFGEWDEETQSWIPQDNKLVIANKLPYPEQNDKPLIDYSYDPELAKVEEAVKACGGNYSKPKALLLQYYREKFKGFSKDVAINGTEAQTAKANALAYNYVIKEFTGINLFDVTMEKTFYEFDVTDQISSIVSGTGTKKFCFVLDSVELDGKKASFASRESENRPYITLNLTDGSTQTFYPEADATIKGGDRKGSSFPSEKELYAQSRGNVAVENDNSSQRALVRFDFSSIPQGTQVVSAAFGICGWTDKSDAPKQIFLGSTTNVTWKENGLTWSNSNFTNNIAFDSQPGMIPSVFKTNYYALTQASSVLASRYLYDRNEIYAYHGIRYMLQYHRNIDTRAYAYNDFLDKGVNGLELANSIYALTDSSYMTPQNFAMLLKSVYCNTEWILEGWNSNSAALNSNHATYYNRGFAALITLFPEFYKANDPLQDDPSYQGLYYGGRGGWIPSLQRRVMYKAKEVSFPDGAGKEVAGGYNMEAYANTVAVLQFATEAEMSEILPDEYYDMMAVAALYFMHGMAPGYRDWGVGNSYGYGSQFINRPVIKQIIDGLDMLLKEDMDKDSERYKKRKEQYDQLIYAYTAGKDGKEPGFDSILYPLARKVVMRDSWDKNAVGATMGISNGGIHGHFDDLSIVLAAYGRYLLADPGKVDYVQNEPYKCWLNSTRAHNTIEINDISQRSGFWSNWEVARGPNGETLVFPFRGDHGLILANNVIADEVEKPENAQYKMILDEKDYTRSNLTALYEFDDRLAIEANPNVKTRHFQGRFLDSELNKTFDYVKGETYNNIGVTYKDDGNVLGGGVKEYTAPDNAHNRSMLFIKSASVPSFYIVTDYVAPVNGNTQENKYSQAWHFTNDANITMDETTKTVKTHFNDANLAVIPVLGKELETEAVLQDGWYHTTANVPAKYVTYIKNAAQPTTFNTILLPMNAGEDYETNTQSLPLEGMSEADASAFSFTMRDTRHGDSVNGVYYNLHNTSAKSEQRVGDYAMDGEMLYADKKDGYTTTAVMKDGTYVKDEKGKYLVKSDGNIGYLGVEWRGTGLYLSASQTDAESEEYVDLSQLTILNQRNSKTVYLNDEPISFKTKDGYVYFGDNPILDDGGAEPTPTEKPMPTKKPSGHGGGSGGGGGSSVPAKPTAKPSEPPAATENPDEEQNAPELDGINPNFAGELSGHWGKKEIASLIRDGVVSGMDDTTLALEKPVTRAEYVAMLIRAKNIPVETYQNEFQDVSSDAWYADILGTAKKYGILSGDEKGNANPDSAVTREEMAKISVKTLEVIEGISIEFHDGIGFADADSISEWAVPYVLAAQELQLMNGFEDGRFAPAVQTIREQAMVVIYRIRMIN